MSKKLGIVLLLFALVAVLYPLAVQQYLWERVNRYEEARIILRPRLDEKSEIQWELFKEAERQGLSVHDYLEIKGIIPCESNYKKDAISPTQDYSILQINWTWEKKAEELGLNFKENWKDNLAMGVWIYKHAGGIRNWVCSLGK